MKVRILHAQYIQGGTMTIWQILRAAINDRKCDQSDEVLHDECERGKVTDLKWVDKFEKSATPPVILKKVIKEQRPRIYVPEMWEHF